MHAVRSGMKWLLSVLRQNLETSAAGLQDDLHALHANRDSGLNKII